MSKTCASLLDRHPDLENELRKMYLDDGDGCIVIAKKLGVTSMTIHKYLKLFNIPRRDFREAGAKQKRFGPYNSMFGKKHTEEFKKEQSERLKAAITKRGKHWATGTKYSPERKAKISEQTKGANNPRWNGGKRKKDGYIEIFAPEHPFRNIGRNTAYEHRLVMEKHLGRYLSPEEVVHHIDGNRENNTLENLALLTPSEHSKIHGAMKVLHKRTYSCKPENWQKAKYKSCLKCKTTTISHRSFGLCAKCYMQEKRHDNLVFWKEGDLNAN